MAGDNFLDMWMGDLPEGDAAEELRNLLNSDDEFRERFRNTDVAGFGIEEQEDARYARIERIYNEMMRRAEEENQQSGRRLSKKDSERIQQLYAEDTQQLYAEDGTVSLPKYTHGLADGGEVDQDPEERYFPNPAETMLLPYKYANVIGHAATDWFNDAASYGKQFLTGEERDNEPLLDQPELQGDEKEISDRMRRAWRANQNFGGFLTPEEFSVSPNDVLGGLGDLYRDVKPELIDIFGEARTNRGEGLAGLASMVGLPRYVPGAKVPKSAMKTATPPKIDPPKPKVAPTKVIRTNTGDAAVSQELYTLTSDPRLAPSDPGYIPPREFHANLLKEGRINFETNAERQLVNNPDFANLSKAYSVDDFIRSTVANSPKETRSTVKSQLDEWISPELRGKKATLQELLDDIGTNKPTIKENYMDDYLLDYGYIRYMPNIPTTNTMITNPAEALETIYPSKYTERSFSVHSPKHGKLFDDPGHNEVSQGTELRETFEPSDDVWNTDNRIFTTRSGMYDIDGVKTYIPAEGQSGIYEMGTSGKKALAAVTASNDIKPNVIESMLAAGGIMEDLPRYLDNPWPIDVVEHTAGRLDYMIPKNLPSSKAFLKGLNNTGHTLDDWTDLVREQQNYIKKKTETIEAQAKRDGASYGQDTEEALVLAKEDAMIKYLPQFNQMLRIKKIPTENLPSSAPLFKEWFPMHMKTSLNDAVEVGADVVRFPINPESVAKQTGQTIYPGRAKAWEDEFTPEMHRDIDIADTIEEESAWIPTKEAQALGPMYEQRTHEGIERIEAEYGIKLNPTEIIDDNDNKFLEIVLTPELKEAFKIVVFNRGGAVYKRPLMNLKY